MTMIRLNNSFEPVPLKSQFFKAILILTIGCIASVLWLTLGHQDSAKPCAASMAWTHLISGASYDVYHPLAQTRTSYNINILKTLLNQRYLSDSKNLVEEGEKRKGVQPSYAFYKMSSYIKI